VASIDEVVTNFTDYLETEWKSMGRSSKSSEVFLILY